MLIDVSVRDLKVGDTLVQTDGRTWEITEVKNGILPGHPYLIVKDIQGNRSEHDTSFQDKITIRAR